MMILGSFLYISVLLINAIAILSEDRFLARRTFDRDPNPGPPLRKAPLSSLNERSGRLGTNKTNVAPIPSVNFSPSSYDPAFGQSPEASVKARTINLIASVRTLMRIPLIVVNTLIIIYEIVLG